MGSFHRASLSLLRLYLFETTPPFHLSTMLEDGLRFGLQPRNTPTPSGIVAQMSLRSIGFVSRKCISAGGRYHRRLSKALALGLGGRSRVALENRKHGRPYGGPHSRTGIPTTSCRERAVVSAGDVPHSGSAKGLIQNRVPIAHWFARLLVQKGDQAREQGRHRACSPNGKSLPIDEHVISGNGIGIGSDIRHSTAGEGHGRAGGARSFEPLLEAGDRKNLTDSSPRRPALSSVIPNGH